MTDEDTRIEKALRKCADARLPEGFAERLVKRIRENKESEERKTSLKSGFARIALVAASMTLLLGFVPGVLDHAPARQARVAAHGDEIRAVNPTSPQDCQLNALAFLGFCREAIRRRMRSLLVRSRKREEEE